MEGFPASVRGRILFIDKDNLNTDGIYGSKHTYRDDMTPEEMAAVTFENYDPNFNTLYQKGDVVVGGLNFGSGSSREQAATALKFKGIPCVIAGSFSETYKRNAFNNGFVVFECPELVTHLRDTLTDRAPTTVGPEITIDYAKSILNVDGKSFPFPPLSPAAQELIVAGGAEKLVASRLRRRNEERRASLLARHRWAASSTRSGLPSTFSAWKRVLRAAAAARDGCALPAACALQTLGR